MAFLGFDRIRLRGSLRLLQTAGCVVSWLGDDRGAAGNEGDDLLLGGMVSRGGASADSFVAKDAADQALLALLLEWSTLAQLTNVTHGDDGDLDWLYGHTGSDRFISDGTSRNYDFAAGVDSAG